MATLDKCERTTRRNESYFQIIAGNAYLLVMVFALSFYAVALLSHKGQMSTDAGTKVIVVIWIGSIFYFFHGMLSDFRRVYKFFVGRMRSNRCFEWVALIYVLGTLFCSAPAVYFLSVGFYAGISRAIDSYSLKILIASFGASLFYSTIVMTMIVNFVAARRGVQCFKTRTKRFVSSSLGGVG
jgi:hypothetical protein